MQDSLGAILAIGLLWLVIKFAFGASSSSNGAGGTGNANTAITQQAPGAALIARDRVRNVPQEMVTTVQGMFPHVSAAAIRYDLARSGSVEITCDRILSEGGLPAPPAGLFGTPGAVPAPPRPAESASSTSTKPNTRTSASLISRFGLETRLQSESSASSTSSSSSEAHVKGKAKENSAASWADSADARQKELRKRKEEMILQARRRLEAKVATANPAS